jgi:hypothetical protein
MYRTTQKLEEQKKQKKLRKRPNKNWRIVVKFLFIIQVTLILDYSYVLKGKD